MEEQGEKKEKKRKKIKKLKKKIRILEEQFSSQQSMLDMTLRYMSETQAQIEASRAALEKANTSLLDSIHYASRIQKALTPTVEMLKACFPDSFVYYRPRDIVSGDMYWLHHTPEFTLLAVIDCTGHGAPAAMLSVLAVSMLDQLVRLQQILSPAEILKGLDELLYRYTQNDNMRMKIRDGLDIALCRIDHHKRVITYSGAHRPLYHVRNGELTELPGARYSLGENDKQRQELIIERQLNLLEDDCIYMFTDGYTDQFGGDKGTKFMTGNFKKLVSQINTLPVQYQRENIVETFKQWKGQRLQTDDVLVVGIKFQSFFKLL